MRGAAPILGVLLLAAASSNLAVSKTEFKIEPGPAVISEEEKAIARDPNAGVEQAVILVEETEQDDTGVLDRTVYHLRAKILGNEARDLADVQIPLRSRRGYLKEWWGRTLLPDGTVLELKQEELKEQTLAKSRRKEARELKGILPGVVPGCVIDFGWTVWDTSQEDLRSVPIQGSWPVRLFRYHWMPPRDHGTAWVITHREGLSIDNRKEGLSVVVTGRDLPPVVEEPVMPPGDEVRATLWLYRTYFFSTGTKDFWDIVAQGAEDRLKTFASFRLPVDKALKAMRIPEDDDLMTKLRKAHDWLTRTVKDVRLISAEEEDEREDRKLEKGRTAGEVIASGEGTDEEIADLYVTFARRLGAEASLLLAADRSDHYWHQELLSLDQFDATLVAVRAPGDPDEKIVFVDPGSGLSFGEVPWWFTGINALLITRKGARPTIVWDAPARRNVSDSRVEVAFEAGGGATVHWLRSGTGQQGYLDKLILRQMPSAERAKRLGELCGAGGGFEVSLADMPALEDLKARFMLHCEGEMAGAGPPEGTEEYDFSFVGSWMPVVPELASTTRVHAVVLPYPEIDLVTVDVASPPGFEPKEAPAPVRIEGPDGDYSLKIEKRAEGYRVQRDFSLLPLAVKPEDYPVLRRYLEDVQRADRTPLVFVRAGAPPS